ncbi:TetR/AcrR family transcriptional regulator [Salinisphaera hydrothermalis]|uniref:Transcriptional regulator, TetR family protein n=1 Tax=Salinisphaera hydrothermalis (strain C41B8) TaxID=1304275 RepID=A0A084IN44_SALHC|nr:TetR/AcrR family transcriptional regulator [Salinisphaera hydrothermalis]KEZ78128.1 transcriptional regulator, TetR family protein [Salinisphaera hydrothermalis C41B8]
MFIRVFVFAVSSCKSPSKKAEQVLDAARRLFVEHGFGATNMDALAAAAGVSKATIYAHYESKEVLFAATARRECRRAVARMAIGDDLVAHRSLEEALTHIGRAFLDTLMSPEIVGLLRMVIAESTRFPELGQIYYDSAPGQTLTSVTCYLDRARRQGWLIDCDTRRAAEQFLSLLRGDLHMRILLGQSPDAAERDPAIAEAVATFTARYATVYPTD